MDLSLRQHKPAEFAPHGQDRRGGLATAAEWDMPPGHCLPLSTQHGRPGLRNLFLREEAAFKALPPRGDPWSNLQG